MTPVQRQIRHGCSALQLDVNAEVTEKLADFVALLQKWNRVYNLTAVRDPQQMITRHILDSLAVVAYLTQGRLLDVGTGAGLPGLPVAMVRPDLSVTLLDANAKKLRFVRQAITELGLHNTEVVQARMQEYQPARSFDMVISRAVASLAELYRQSAHLVRPGGRMLFMKAGMPDREIQDLGAHRERLHVERLQVPGLEAERHLFWLELTMESATKS